MKNYLNVKFPSKITNVQLSRALLIGFLADLDLPMSLIMMKQKKLNLN